MKMVCMCQGGNSRSVACAFLMKYEYGHDALSLSWQANSDETKNMLFDWADAIIVMTEDFTQYVPTKYWAKLAVVDVGDDIWGNGLHPDLLNKIRGLLKNGLSIGRRTVQDEVKFNAAIIG